MLVRGVAAVAAASVMWGVAMATAPTINADPDYNAFVTDARALGFTGSSENLVRVGYMLCNQVRQGVPESVIAEAIAGYTGENAPASMPSSGTVVRLIHSAIRHLCP